MFTSSLIMTIFRELLPFLKEALLEGQSLRVWLKSNWLTFAWLINMFVLTLLISVLADSVTGALRREHIAEQQARTVLLYADTMITQYKRLRAENVALKVRVAELEATEADNTATIARYEEMMDKCGVNYTDQGQCRVVRQAPPRSTSRATTRPKPRTPPISVPEQQQQTPTATEPKQRPGFFNRLREAFRRDNAEEPQKDGP